MLFQATRNNDGTVTAIFPSWEEFSKQIKSGSQEPFKSETVEEPKSDIQSIISNTLNRLGVPCHIKGFAFIREALTILENDFAVIDKVTKTLYPDIAVKFYTTLNKVERAIRHAIEVSWSRGDREFYDMLFGYSVDANKSKATNSQFLAAVADYIIRSGVK